MFTFAVLFRFSPVWLCFAVADAVALAALILKEVYDSKHKESHSVETLDILYGVFGIAKVNIAFLIMFV